MYTGDRETTGPVFDKQPTFIHQNESDFLQRSQISGRLCTNSKQFVNFPFGFIFRASSTVLLSSSKLTCALLFKVDLIFGNSQKIFEAEPAK